MPDNILCDRKFFAARCPRVVLFPTRRKLFEVGRAVEWSRHKTGGETGTQLCSMKIFISPFLSSKNEQKYNNKYTKN